ncbi:MAG: hypothetical protein AAGF73_17780 [Actinomycetota bacterium]
MQTPGAWARTATFEDLWSQAPRNSLIIVPANVPETACTDESSQVLAQPWPDTTSPETVETYGTDVLRQRADALRTDDCDVALLRSGRLAPTNVCGFFVSQLQLSPGLPAATRVIRCIEFDAGLCSLRDAAALTNPLVGGWIERWCSSGLPVNIVIVDFFESSDMVDEMITANRSIGADGCAG